MSGKKWTPEDWQKIEYVFQGSAAGDGQQTVPGIGSFEKGGVLLPYSEAHAAQVEKTGFFKPRLRTVEAQPDTTNLSVQGEAAGLPVDTDTKPTADAGKADAQKAADTSAGSKK